MGGVASGADTIIYSPSTNDFWLHIDDFAGTPAFQQLGYTQTSVSSDNLFYTVNNTGSVAVTAVPEPSSFAMLLWLGVFGLGFVGLAVFRRQRSRECPG